jgi:hypothetical protein
MWAAQHAACCKVLAVLQHAEAFVHKWDCMRRRTFETNRYMTSSDVRRVKWGMLLEFAFS